MTSVTHKYSASNVYCLIKQFFSEAATSGVLTRQVGGVIGVLEELKIHPDLDRSVFIGYGVAKTLFDIDEEPTTIYLRANPTFIEDGEKGIHVGRISILFVCDISIALAKSSLE